MNALLSGQPKNDDFQKHLKRRQFIGKIWGRLFALCNALALMTLILLALNITNNAFGLVAMRYEVQPDTLADRPLDDLSAVELAQLLTDNLDKRVRVLIRDELSQVASDDFTRLPLSEVLRGKVFAPELAEASINDLTPEQFTQILVDNLSRDRLHSLVMSQLVKPTVVKSWQLFPSLFQRAAIEAEFAEKYADAELVFRSWVSPDFISHPIASEATVAGLRTALLGTLWVIVICVAFSFPLGIGAAIYLEEYATDNWMNRLIETNIRNLAGVPSIIYGMLGLAVFVRTFAYFTSGQFVGVTDSNGRTVVSAGLTLGLVILPVIIINAQEAIRAVPSSLREASFGLGATRWQTISRAVLPVALPGILTGIILSLSRAIGETAPLIVVGASTFIGIDPNGPFSKFTVVPIQIYQWTSRPELEFKNAAAAAIIVLMALLLLLNSSAIILRNYYTRKLQG